MCSLDGINGINLHHNKGLSDIIARRLFALPLIGSQGLQCLLLSHQSQACQVECSTLMGLIKEVADIFLYPSPVSHLSHCEEQVNVKKKKTVEVEEHVPC